MSAKVIELMLKEIGIEISKLLKVMLANYSFLEGRMVAQIQVAYDLTLTEFYMMQTKIKVALIYDMISERMMVFDLVTDLSNSTFTRHDLFLPIGKIAIFLYS